MRKKYQSEILEVLHGMAEDLHQIGAINDARMDEYNHDCLVQKTDQSYKTENTQVRTVTPSLAGQITMNK
jgi:DNA-binding transcriptional regulator YiaG